MRRFLKSAMGALYIASTIAWKDIVDALKNKHTAVNIVVLLGVVGFFFWMSTARPFDKRIDVVVYDQGDTQLEIGSTELADGYSFEFYEASSLEQMEEMMGFKELGLVLPADFDQVMQASSEPTLDGYILWADRDRARDLEATYSQKFTELLGQPVRVSVGEHVIKPQPDIDASSVNAHMLFVVFWMALCVVPHLMLEERQTKTLEALLVTPASAGQVVLGKALAGLFYLALAGGLAFALNRAYVVHWGWAMQAFLCCALFSIGLALALGGLIQSPQQLSMWLILVAVGLMVPGLFAHERFLTPALKTVFSLFPTAALSMLFRLSLSSNIPSNLALPNLAIALGWTVFVFAIVIWRLRRSDR